MAIAEYEDVPENGRCCDGKARAQEARGGADNMIRDDIDAVAMLSSRSAGGSLSLSVDVAAAVEVPPTADMLVF